MMHPLDLLARHLLSSAEAPDCLLVRGTESSSGVLPPPATIGRSKKRLQSCGANRAELPMLITPLEVLD